MAELLHVPEVAAGATEVVVSEWLVEPGGTLEVGEPFAVIETEKAVVEVEAESNATLLRPLVTPGSQVEVGSPMALLGSSDDLGSDLDALLAELGVTTATTKLEPAGRDTAESPSTGTTAEPDAASQKPERPAVDASPHGADGARTFVSPIARKLLREAGISPESVKGTGPGGRIVRRDVEKATAQQEAATPASTAPDSGTDTREPARQQPATAEGHYSVVPHTRLRRAVAARLTQSKQEIPHFYVKRSAVIDELLALRQQINARSRVRISVNDFLIRAVAVAHQAVPEANVIWTDEGMRVFETVDVSVAIASERGLVTPVLRSVERASLGAVSTAVRSYVEQANAGRLQQKDLEGGTISVTNLGMFGVDEFSAIINPPQSAILAVGAAAPAPRVVDGEVRVVTALQLVLSVDHRAIDGALAAQWMAALVDAVENPISLVV